MRHYYLVAQQHPIAEQEEVDLGNPLEILVYIVVPIALIVFYFILRKRNKAQKKEE